MTQYRVQPRKHETGRVARETACELRPSNGTASLPHTGGSRGNQTLTSVLSPAGLPLTTPNWGRGQGEPLVKFTVAFLQTGSWGSDQGRRADGGLEQQREDRH